MLISIKFRAFAARCGGCLGELWIRKGADLVAMDVP